jgi:hypothetical protein
MRSTCRRDDGSSLVEFVYLAVLLLVPLVYVVLTAVSVQRAAFGLTAAAREAGRAYATAGDDRLGEDRAEAIAALAVRDQGVTWQERGRVVLCGTCDYAPGSAYTVDLRARIPLPLVPSWLCPGHCLAAITVTAHHSGRLSCYGGTGTPAAC